MKRQVGGLISKGRLGLLTSGRWEPWSAGVRWGHLTQVLTDAPGGRR